MREGQTQGIKPGGRDRHIDIHTPHDTCEVTGNLNPKP